ncbi:hypothetical protein DES53_11925 [Roseimicrobium gellanilyticum]|uniref:Uncharacterized protein n=2 Tax=Roseimicrobium gellanilyticum TaxID=748857 RepID=A0A366H2S0_9BACT|nr:hypothetical protein DES53_11925 [Roseimicrobium gellanilyticum]
MEVFGITALVLAASATVFLIQVSCWHQVLGGREHYLKTRRWLMIASVGFPLYAVLHLGISRFLGEDVSLVKVVAALAGTIWAAMLTLWGHHLAARWRGFTR